MLIKYINLSQQLPASLLTSLQTVKGFDEKTFTTVHASGAQVTSVRINPGKKNELSGTQLAESLEPVPWSSNGYYLPERPSFTADPLFHAGAYYVQEASSMFLEEALKQSCDLSGPLRVLDLCAAPGGKSTLIQSLLSEDSLLVSNEVIKTRVGILSENITKWGAVNVVVTNNDPRDFQKLTGYFDVIVVDAPCSGSGLFRKDPAAISEWSEANVQLCAQRQERILADIFSSLKPGGILIYSTCSYSYEEDESICDFVVNSLSATSLRYQLKPEWNIVETTAARSGAFGYRFYPDRLKGEGFFIAGFRRQGDEEITQAYSFKNKNQLSRATKDELEAIKKMIADVSRFSFLKWQENILAFPASLQDDLFLLQANLYIKKAGVSIGVVIKAELIPDHELAMTGLLSADVPYYNADKETALQYLRRHDIKCDTVAKGWALLRYNNIALGWIKVLSNRINNYYPKDWRILNK